MAAITSNNAAKRTYPRKKETGRIKGLLRALSRKTNKDSYENLVAGGNFEDAKV